MKKRCSQSAKTEGTAFLRRSICCFFEKRPSASLNSPLFAKGRIQKGGSNRQSADARRLHPSGAARPHLDAIQTARRRRSRFASARKYWNSLVRKKSSRNTRFGTTAQSIPRPSSWTDWAGLRLPSSRAGRMWRCRSKMVCMLSFRFR